jgi:leucyl-tRNA synthetase
MVRDEGGKVYPLDESELPLLLPEVEHYEPAGTGESPLANITDWVNVKGYITDNGTFKKSTDGQSFKRETNTMPQWAGSSWYYLRYIDPTNENALVDKTAEEKWSPVDFYVGGAEHATRHLIYARFWHKFLYDIGVVNYQEPFKRLQNVGLILAEDGRKMSKRFGNVVNPDDIVREFGADTLRVYEMFMGPFDQSVAWSTKSMAGVERFLERVWKIQDFVGKDGADTILPLLHKTIKKVTEDIESFKFNTAISQMMILVNAIEEVKGIKESDWKMFLQLLAPFAPHMTEELWEKLGNTSSIHTASWPKFDEALTIEKEVTIALQVNGKLRDTFTVETDLGEEELKKLAQNTEGYKKYVGEVVPKKVIIIKNKLINVVI